MHLQGFNRLSPQRQILQPSKRHVRHDPLLFAIVEAEHTEQISQRSRRSPRVIPCRY